MVSDTLRFPHNLICRRF